MAMIRPETEMKDSGVQWIGYIPSSWTIFPANGVFSEAKEKNTVLKFTNAFSFKYGEIVDKKQVGDVDNNLKETLSSYTIVRKNTIMINGLNLNYDFISQRVAIVNESGVITSAYLAIQPDENKINPRFVLYLLKSYDYQQVFHGLGSGIRKTLKYQDFKKIMIVAPPLSEQQAIADYLDETCSKIDEIIAEAKASIDEYKELKQSVIFEAVTKGLDKNVEMKDSENLAIGKIPKHWVKVRVKNVATRITVGVVVTPANYFDDAGTVAFLRGINVKEYVINSEPMMYITEETNKELSKTIVHTNDLVIVRDGAIGVTAVIPEKYDGANVVSMIIVSLGSEYNHDYLCYVLNSYVGKIQFNLTKIGSALSHTSVSSVSNIEIPKPSINEQIDIVNYLKGQHKKLDSLIAEKESLIKDLESYKKSLIYEVVTGKRRVV